MGDSLRKLKEPTYRMTRPHLGESSILTLYTDVSSLGLLRDVPGLLHRTFPCPLIDRLLLHAHFPSDKSR